MLSESAEAASAILSTQVFLIKHNLMCTFLILLFNYHAFILILSSKNLVIHCETTKYPLTDDLLYSHCLLLTLYGYSNEKLVVDHCCPVFKD